MRISDWSSDVCSSDLASAVVQWEEARRRYTELSGQIEGNEEGALNQVFSKAYDAAGAQLCGALLTHLPHDQPLDCPFISLPNLEGQQRTFSKAKIVALDSQ